MPTTVKRVLIFRLGSLGDTVVALPALHLIARAFPQAERRLLTNFPVSAKAAPAESILENSGLVHGYFQYPIGTRNPLTLLALWWRLILWRPQALIYLGARRGIDSARRDAIFFRLCGIRRLIGVPLTEDMQENRFEESTQSLEPEAARLVRNIVELGHADLDAPASWDLRLTPEEHERAAEALLPAAGRPILAVSVGTKMQSKDWGRENWRALLAELATLYPDHALTLSGSAEESAASEFAAEGWRAASAGPAVNLCGHLTPRESAAVFTRARLFIGHDSGPMHLAAAVQTPCVAIFAARNKPRVWFPYGKHHRVLYHRTDCWGCRLETCIVEKKKCLASITVPEVLAEARALLDGPPRLFHRSNVDILSAAPMRILLVGNYVLDRQSSMARYADFLRAQMALRGHHVEVARPQPIFGKLVRRPWVRKWLGYVDKYLLFPPRLRAQSRDFDLVHICDHGNAIYLPHTAGRPASVTCHDLLQIASAQGRYPQLQVVATGRLQQRWIRKHLARARNVVCVSANTAGEFAEYVSRDTPNLAVIPNALSLPGGPSARADVDRLRSSLGLSDGEQYLLHVGANHWYKNRSGLLRIYKALCEELRDAGLPVFRLVIAGERLPPQLHEFIDANGLQSAVIEVPGPADEDLRTLYTGAAALLFPSLYEGFGWPVVEAQSCGCPVITSNRPPMTEVAANSALYIDPEDELAAAAHIAASLNLLPRLREAGFTNISRFDPSRIAARYETFFATVARCHTLEAATPLVHANRE